MKENALILSSAAPSGTPPKVSVLMIAYNHERFIAQAIESILRQQTTFPYEIVLGEDCSPDRTRAIALDYQRRYPDTIRLLLPPKNLGAMRNFAETLAACRGTYVAMLEGDDYWTSPHKLQQQVDYLESYPECSICFHNVTAYNEENGKRFLMVPGDQKERSTAEDLLVSDFIPTCSMLFRRAWIGALPDWIFSLKQADWPLEFLLAQHGDIAYLPEDMAVYRIHPGGTWSRMTAIENYREKERFYAALQAHIQGRYDRQIRAALASLWGQLAGEYAKAGELRNAWIYAGKSFANRRFDEQFSLRMSAAMLLRMYLRAMRQRLRRGMSA